MKLAIITFLLFIISNNSFAKDCDLELLKTKNHGYSTSFSYLLSKNCNINPPSDNVSKKNLSKKLKEILSQIIKSDIYKANCPNCSIDIFTDKDALEWDYKIMNWSSLGIDNSSYNQMRNNKKIQSLIKNNLALQFEDFGYFKGEIQIYPEI